VAQTFLSAAGLLNIQKKAGAGGFSSARQGVCRSTRCVFFWVFYVKRSDPVVPEQGKHDSDLQNGELRPLVFPPITFSRQVAFQIANFLNV